MPEPKPDKGNLIQRLNDAVPDLDVQFQYISVAVRLLVVFWSGALVTLNYMPKIPGLTSGEKQDITFPASLLASSLASFGLDKSSKEKDDGTSTVRPAEGGGNYQTIRVITPLEIKGAEVVKTESATSPKDGKLT